MWVYIIFLFYSVIEDEIVQFFLGLNVLYVYFMFYVFGLYVGKNNGEVYVEFRIVGDCI